MIMPSLPSARRWARLVADRKRAGQLDKLSKAQQAEVRKLIDENKGKEARERLAELDSERRTRERVRSKLRRVMAKPKEQRKGTNPFEGSPFHEIQILRELYDGRQR